MKINILDAGIRYKSGHHFDYNLKLFKHLSQTGHDVHVYGYSGMDNEVAEAFTAHGELTRLFRIYQYCDGSEYDWFAPDLVQYHVESAAIAEDLRAVRRADLWIWSTLEPQHLNACAAFGVRDPMVGCLYWDPGVEWRSFAALLWRDALVAARRENLRFTLASVEGEVRHRFSPIRGPVRFMVLPHPVDGPPIAEPKTILKRIGFFGHQRGEKGLHLMAPLIERLIADGYAATLQNSNSEFEMPDVPGLERLGYVDDLAAAIARCDLVVLPYEIERYKARGSGILVECLALGVPVSAPIGTLPGRMIEQFGVGPLFGAVQPDSIYRAIKSIESDYPALAARSFNVAGQFVRRNGVARFASALLSAAS
jgi:glycosyltransferase involved in cell wall biosynthesis